MSKLRNVYDSYKIKGDKNHIILLFSFLTSP